MDSAILVYLQSQSMKEVGIILKRCKVSKHVTNRNEYVVPTPRRLRGTESSSSSFTYQLQPRMTISLQMALSPQFLPLPSSMLLRLASAWKRQTSCRLSTRAATTPIHQVAGRYLYVDFKMRYIIIRTPTIVI